jgi:hypothetical protein
LTTPLRLLSASDAPSPQAEKGNSASETSGIFANLI